MTKTVQVIGNQVGFEVRANHTVVARVDNYYKAMEIARAIADGRKIVTKNIF